jgi:hypothetical protein
MQPVFDQVNGTLKKFGIINAGKVSVRYSLQNNIFNPGDIVYLTISSNLLHTD